MIERFSILYAGHADVENIGYDGMPVNERFLSDEQLASALHNTEAVAKMADRLGFHTLWLAEHHFQREGFECLPNLLMHSVHLSHLTKNIKFGCAFNVATEWHPLRLAEDYALADHLTDGRIIFGLGRGYHVREVESFGAPLLDKDANRDLFEEQVEILFKAFNNPSFSHHGKHYDIPPRVPYRGYQLEEITLVPRPKHLPVECWQPIVSSSKRGIDLMIKHGIKAISGGARSVVEAWQDAQARAGRETQLGEDFIIIEPFYISESREKAPEEARLYFEEHTKVVGPLGLLGGLTEEQMKDLENPTQELWATLPTVEDAVSAGALLCGTSEQIIESLMLLQDLYPGLREFIILPFLSTPRDVVLEQIERFAEEVMPAFKVAETKAAS